MASVSRSLHSTSERSFAAHAKHVSCSKPSAGEDWAVSSRSALGQSSVSGSRRSTSECVGQTFL